MVGRNVTKKNETVDDVARLLEESAHTPVVSVNENMRKSAQLLRQLNDALTKCEMKLEEVENELELLRDECPIRRE